MPVMSKADLCRLIPHQGTMCLLNTDEQWDETSITCKTTPTGWPIFGSHGPPAGFVFESEILIEAGRRGIGSVTVPFAAIYGRHLCGSHFRQVKDVTLIVRMIARKLLARGMNVPGLIRSRVRPACRNGHGYPCRRL